MPISVDLITEFKNKIPGQEPGHYTKAQHRRYLFFVDGGVGECGVQVGEDVSYCDIDI